MTRHLSASLISWASILEDGTREQALRTSEMPFIYPHMALMPDAHLGKGATVGSVIPTRGAIIPAAVGVDIGCGMDAVLTQWTKDDVAATGAPLVDLREGIERRIPLSAGGRNQTLTPSAEERVGALATLAEQLEMPDPASFVGGWALQLGSLGSGNHFIEVSLDEQDRVWLFLHSGSRGVGNRIAQHHIRVARELMERYFIRLEDLDLAYLVEGTDEFWAYVRALRWAQEFARQNRAEMMDRVVDAAASFMGEDVERREEISCHHNYTEQERHFGEKVWLSRKGAIDAHEGVMGLIPGSMGTRSYVVEGKGNRDSLCSAPHGAGREYSRSRARRTFTVEQLEEAMVGIEYRRTDAFIDEIPQAYKDIDVVMADAADLVRVRHELRQIVNVKGD
ncbi:RtcB family protein [Actinotalea sp. BY-33]|uniref:3'-phosphate/5'-hydroxy nucleic acid ligase n=1 Tax=Actinotalea soli TaxID=2819234 RepID=A0A939LUH7_9CELL|nr:RtcB family protein [Actinotalea soli]MBO1752925.1 RtcB family protein [Actinotalea soli]